MPEETNTHPNAPITDPSLLPEPTLQPDSLPEGGTPMFASTEIPWWNNGIWGSAGYAIPAAVGKHNTKNAALHAIHAFIGSELFALMHAPDVQFRRPPNFEWLHSVAKMVRLGRKRMADRSISWTDERRGDAQRATNNLQQFIVFPVPFFGGRIRLQAAEIYCRKCLVLLSEIQQHPDNNYDDDVTDFVTSLVDDCLFQIQYDIATRFLGATREEAMDPGYVLPQITAENYHPDELFTEAEMTDERPPDRWWPTSNDLTAIKGIPSSVAAAYAMRWPVAGDAFYGDYGAHETTFPGINARTFRPGSAAAEG